MEKFLLEDKYQPQKVADVILPARLKTIFQNYVTQGAIPNMVLTGRAGVGKTTVAVAMCDELDADYYLVSGSMEGGIDKLRTDIMRFATTVSFSGGRKYVIIDEADGMTLAMQEGLRNFINEFKGNCGFILTANYANKLLEPLKSRCPVIDFNLTKEELAACAKEFTVRLIDILKKENVEVRSKPALMQLVAKFMPDWRRVFGEVQKFVPLGYIDETILINLQEASIKELVKAMKEKNYTAVRKWVGESDFDQNDVFRKFYDVASELFMPSAIPALVSILGKYQYYAAFAADPEINLAACLAEIMVECDWR